MRLTLVLTFYVALLAAVQIARADDTSDYFAGVYVLEGSREPSSTAEMDALQLKCLLAPGLINERGFGVGYFLDRELFLSKGEISYIQGQEYKCRYSPATRKETCDSKEFSDGKSLTYYRSNVYQVFTQDEQRGHSLLTPEEVVAWNSRGEVNPSSRFAYRRCDCLAGSDFEARASTRMNEHSSEETGFRLFWWNRDVTSEELDLARKVQKKFGGCRPAIS
jgi:hypothetical protein